MPSPMLWAAMLPHTSTPATPSLVATPGGNAPAADALAGAACWALQFTPRVVCMAATNTAGANAPPWPDALALELSASQRLFGGWRTLQQRLQTEGAAQQLQAPAWASTCLGAVALARYGQSMRARNAFASQLDALPLHALDAVAAHAPTLARLGCTTLGQVRALPRGGMVRRFDRALLTALDQAYGTVPEAYPWAALPQQFYARWELPYRVEHADALLHGAQRLLLQLCGWLAAQRAGITAFTLRWCHDAMRAKSAGDGGEITIRTAEPTRQLAHLARLLQEHLAHTRLEAPVGELALLADHPVPLTETSASLLAERVAHQEALGPVLERIAARVGSSHVVRPHVQCDHRPEWQVRWLPAAQALPRQPVEAPPWPQPSFLLDKPLRLAQDRQGQPLYQGRLALIAGPHRLEAGWWHRSPGFMAPADGDDADQAQADAEAQTPSQTQLLALRDYWVALSSQHVALWVYHTRLQSDTGAWFLHGMFA